MEISALLQIVQFVAYAVVATVFVVMIKSDVKILKVEMKGITANLGILNNSFEKLGIILTKVAVQDQRITGIEEDVREMKHGKGFISGRSSIDGEYGIK